MEVALTRPVVQHMQAHDLKLHHYSLHTTYLVELRSEESLPWLTFAAIAFALLLVILTSPDMIDCKKLTTKH